MRRFPDTRLPAVAAALILASGCTSTTPTSPSAVSSQPSAIAGSQFAGAQAVADTSTLSASSLPLDTIGPPTQTGTATGERIVGKTAIEPAYDADSGTLMYLLTPEKAPLPATANGHAVSPLYIVEYPAGSTAAGGGAFNCEGVPGNCPDHDGLVADVAAGAMPSVYAGGVLGHDHVGDPPGQPDFNIAWEVIEVVFTSSDAANTRLTTDTAIADAVAAGDAIEIDLGFAFNCNVVPASLYWQGTPVA